VHLIKTIITVKIYNPSICFGYQRSCSHIRSAITSGNLCLML